MSKRKALIHILLDRTIAEAEARVSAEARIDALTAAAKEASEAYGKLDVQLVDYNELCDRAEAVVAAMRNVKCSVAVRDALDELHQSVVKCNTVF